MSENERNLKRILFLVNPRSGPRYRRLLHHFSLTAQRPSIEGATVDTFQILDARETRGRIKKALKEHYDIIAVAGGDGSVNLVINEIAGKGVPLLIIPQGSGNGLARHLRLPMEANKAFTLWKTGKLSNADSGLVNDHRFASLAGIGFDAHVAKRYNRLRQRGFLSYVYVVIREYFRYKPRRYLLRIDGKIIDTKALFIVFANGSQFGYNTNIAPEASVSDGYLDVVIFRKIPLKDIPAFLLNLLEGQLAKTPYAEIIRAREITVLRRKGRTVNIDGEAVRMPGRLDVRIDPNSLNIFIPKS